MEKQHAVLVKKLPFTQDTQSSFKSSFLVGKSFLGYENLTMNFGCVGKLGSIVEEINEMHMHDYDQLILFFSTSPDDMLGLGATVEVRCGRDRRAPRIHRADRDIHPEGYTAFSCESAEHGQRNLFSLPCPAPRRLRRYPTQPS